MKNLTLFRESPFILLSVLFWLVVGVTIGLSGLAENFYDEHAWHLPAIRQIAEKWPSVSIKADSVSASAPGYHWFLASVANATGGNLVILRLVNAFTSYALIVLLYFWVRQRLPASLSGLLIAPLATSSSFVKQAAWIMTDNPSLLLATMILLLTLRPVVSWGTLVCASLLGATTMFVRHIHAWVLASLVAKSYFASIYRDRTLLSLSRFALVSCLMLTPSLLVLATLYLSWGGLVPNRFSNTSGVSLCSQCYLLTLFGLIGVIYLGTDLPRLARSMSKKALIWGSLGILLMSLILTLPTGTSYDPEQGRWGGFLWPLIRSFPTIGDRSTFFFFAVPVGLSLVGAFYLLTAEAGARQEAAILSFSLGAWILSFVVSIQVFHRYFEPLIIIFFILSAAYRFRNRLPSEWTDRALVAYTAFQLLFTCCSIYESLY